MEVYHQTQFSIHHTQFSICSEKTRVSTFLRRKRPSLVAQMVKNLPAIWETWVQSLGQEDPLEKEMATHSSTLAWRIPWTEEAGRLQSMGLQIGTRLSDTFTFFGRKKLTFNSAPSVDPGRC